MRKDIKTHFEFYVKLLFLSATLIVPLIFYVNVKQHYEFPKTMASRFFMIPAVVAFFFAACGRFWHAKNPFRLPMLVLGAAATLSALRSVNLCETLDSKYLLDICLYMLAGHMIVAVAFKQKDVHLFAIIVTAAAVLSGLYGIVQFFQLEEKVFFGPLEFMATIKGDRVRPVAFQGNRNYSSEFYNFALPMALAALFITRRWSTRIVLFIGILMIRWHLLISDTRATEVGLLFSFPVVLFILFWVKREEWPRLILFLIFFSLFEHLMDLPAEYRGFARIPEGKPLITVLKTFVAPLAVFVMYYFALPILSRLMWPQPSTQGYTPKQYLKKLFLDLINGRRSPYAEVTDKGFSPTRRIQHGFLFAIVTLGVLYVGITKTYDITRDYHHYQIQEQVFRLRTPTYSSFFDPWLGPQENLVYLAKHPDMEYKWWRDPIPPDAEWSPPGFKKYLQDRIDGLFFWDKSITFRIEVYNSAIHMARDNILLGIGIGTFKIVHDLYTSQLERFVLGKEVLGRKVHDEYLTFAAMHGIFGLLALLWIQLIILKMGVRVFRQYRQDKLAGLIKRVGSRQRARVLFYLVLGLFWGMLINAFSQIFGHSLTIPTSHFLFWAMLGLLTCLYHEVFQTPDPPGEKAEEKSFLARLPGMETFNNRLVAGVVVSLILTIPCFYHWMGENLLQAGMQTRRWVDYKNGQIRDLYQKSGGSITREQERTASRYLYQIMMANVPRLTPEEPFVSFEDAQDKMVDSLFHHFEESIRMWPYHMETYYIFGRYCIDFEQWEKGVEVLTRDLFMNPNYKWAHNNIGVCFDRLGLHHRARDVYYRALIIDPQQIFAHFNLAQGYLTREKNHRLAAKHFKGVLDSNPKRLDVYGKLAYCLMQTDQYEEAAEVLGDYFYLKETGKRWAEGEFVNHDEQNYNFLLKIHKELDQPEKALEAIENLVRVAPQKIRYLQMYADELRKQGRNAEALEKAKVINQVQPGNVRVLLLIAELEMLVNEDAEKALEAIREAKSINEKLTRQLLPNLAALESLRSSPEYQELIPEQ